MHFWRCGECGEWQSTTPTWGGLFYKEIATTMNTPVAIVMSRLHGGDDSYARP